MKYKQITSFTGDLIETILKGRDIEDINLFLNPDSSSDTDLRMIKNIDAGLKLVDDAIKHNKKILILVDSDCDGITSGSIMYQYLKMVKPELRVDYYIHETKLHGLTKQFMGFLTSEMDKGNMYDLIIVPDAGSNDIENIKHIETVYGANVLIIDHHEIERPSEFGVIINNQDCANTNSNLTGAGMVYIFCKALEEIYDTGRLEELSDLALIGLVGDGANLRENEVRFLCSTAIKNINNNLLAAFYEANGKGTDGLVIKDLSFGGIIPMINAIVRVGTTEEKHQLFKTISNIDCDYTIVVEKRKLNKATRKYEMKSFTLDAYEYMVELGLKAKSRQDAITKKAIKDASKQYDEKAGIQIFVVEDEDGSKATTGLLANKLSNLYQQPCIVMWDDGKENYIGSLRGNVKVLSDFKQWCIDTELFELAQGHANAAGIIIKKENFDKLKEKTYQVEAEEFCFDVDNIYQRYVDAEDIKLIDRYKGLWFGGVNEPMFAVENVKVNKAALQLNKTTLKFFFNGVTYVKFKSSEEEFEALKNAGGPFDDSFTLNMVGKFSMNEWGGKSYPQFIIEDFELIEEKIEAPNIYGMFA